MRRVSSGAAALAVAALLLPGAPALAQKKKKTELEQLEKQEAKTDYAALQAKALERYAKAPDDRLAAFIVSNDIRVADVPGMTKLLNDLAATLLAGWTGPKLPYRVVVTADSVPVALAHSVGVIEISTGMIERLGSGNALAALMAHELAHVLARHESNREKTAKLLETLVGATSSVGVYASQGKVQTTVKGTATLTPQSQNLLVASYSSQAMLSDAMAPQMKSGQEIEADRIAADLLAKSPFSADGQAEFFETLAKAEAARSARLDTSATLITALTSDRMQSAVAGGDQTKKLAAGLGTGLVALLTTGLFKDIGGKSGGEADPAKRLAKYQEYAEVYGGEYPLQDEKNATYMGFQQRLAMIRKSKGWTSAVTAAAKASEAHRALVTIDLANAAKAAGKPFAETVPPMPASAALPNDPQIPGLYHTKGLLSAREGQLATAQKLLETGAQSRLFPRSGHHLLGGLYLALGNGKQAGFAIDRGIARAGREREFLDLKVGAAMLGGQLAQAETLAARCLSEGGESLYSACRARLGYDAACAAKTPEGKMAFDVARTGKGLKDATNLALQLDRKGGACA